MTQQPEDTGTQGEMVTGDGYGVAIYELYRYCGGSEEGGWWYNDQDFRELIEAPEGTDPWTEEQAEEAAQEERAGKWANKEGREADLYSIAYRGGAYTYEIIPPHTKVEMYISGYRPYE